MKTSVEYRESKILFQQKSMLDRTLFYMKFDAHKFIVYKILDPFEPEYRVLKLLHYNYHQYNSIRLFE